MRGISSQKLINSGRKLRKQQTPWETKLWYLLRNRRFKEFKFRRQYPIGNFIVDFCCLSNKLIIELDGSGHLSVENRIYDKRRDEYLREQGYKVLRIYNNDMEFDLESVLNKVYSLLK